MARASSRRSGPSSSASRRRPRELGACSCSASRSRTARASTTARRWCIAGTILGLVPKEKLPTYNVFYEGRTFARGCPGCYDERRTACRSATCSSTSTSARSALEVCEDIWSPDGPMRRRGYAGAELVVNVSASPFRLGVCATRREMIATRAGRQPVHARLREPGRRATTGSSSTAAASSSRTAGSCSRRRASRGLRGDDGRSRSHARACAPRTRPGASTSEAFAAERSRRSRVSTVDREPDADASALALPGAAAPELLPARRRDAQRRRARTFCEDLLDALALGIGDYFEKTGASRRSASRSRAGATRCSRCSSRTAGAPLRRSARGEKPKAREILRAFFMPTRYSSTETQARGGAGRARSSARRSRSSRSTRRSSASSRRIAEDAAARRDARRR